MYKDKVVLCGASAYEQLVEEENGEIRKVLSGEVSVRGLYSYV